MSTLTLNDTLTRILAIAGRIVLAAFFILAGVGKIADYGFYAEMMQGAGLGPVAILLPATILLEIGAGLLVALGRWFAAPAALALAIFTVATNIFFHAFWSAPEAMAQIQLSLFLKNMAIAGGLLVVANTVERRSA